MDQLSLAVSGVSAEAGLTEFNLEDAKVKRAMLRCAKEVILAAAATKFGRTAFAAAAPVAALRRLIAAAPPLASHPGSSLGAAFVADIGVGASGDWGEIERHVELSTVTVPDFGRHKRYQGLLGLYREIYEALENVYPRL